MPRAAVLHGWQEPLVGLLPGAYVVVLGGPEDFVRARGSGLALRDTVLIVTEEGFQQAGLFRLPLEQLNVTRQMLATQTAVLAVDACRVPGKPRVPWGRVRSYRRFDDKGDKPELVEAPKANELGRWPTNLVLVHSRRCRGDRCEAGCPVMQLNSYEDSEVPPASYFPHFRSVEDVGLWLKRLVGAD